MPLIENDYLRHGYSENFVHSMRESSLHYINQKLCPISLKSTSARNKKIFPPAIPYLNYNLHDRLRNIISSAQQVSGYSMSINIPAVKLYKKSKNIFYTKTKHKTLISKFCHKN